MLRWPAKNWHFKQRNYLLFQNDSSIDVCKPYAPLKVDKRQMDWSLDPYGDRTWRLYFHSMFWMSAVIFGLKKADLTQEERQELVEFLKHAAVSFCSYFKGLSGRIPDSIWDDHSSSYRLSYLALIYQTYIKDQLTEDEKLLLLEVVDIHLNRVHEFMDDAKWENSNHRLFQIEGYCDAAMIFHKGSKIGDSALETGKEYFLQFVERNISLSDGTTKEHATFYHAFLMGHIQDTREYFQGNSVHFDLDFDTLFRKMNRFLWTISPDTYLLPGVGDTKHNMRFGRHHIERFEKPEFDDGTMEYVKSGGSAGKKPDSLTAFEDDGYYVFRNGSIEENELYSLFLEKRYIGPHGHEDGSSFITYFNKQPVFVDGGGPYRYGNRLRYHYFQKQMAHNTVIINDNRRYLTKVRSIHQEPGLNLVEAVAEMGDGVLWSRSFAHCFDDVLLFIDQVSSKALEENIYQRFLISPDITVTQLAGGAYILAGNCFNATMENFELPGCSHSLNDQANSHSFKEPIKSLLDPSADTEELIIRGHIGVVTPKDTKFEKCPAINIPLRASAPRLTMVSFRSPCEIKCLQRNGGWDISLRRQGGEQVRFSIRYDDQAGGLSAAISVPKQPTVSIPGQPAVCV